MTKAIRALAACSVFDTEWSTDKDQKKSAKALEEQLAEFGFHVTEILCDRCNDAPASCKDIMTGVRRCNWCCYHGARDGEACRTFKVVPP